MASSTVNGVVVAITSAMLANVSVPDRDSRQKDATRRVRVSEVISARIDPDTRTIVVVTDQGQKASGELPKGTKLPQPGEADEDGDGAAKKEG